MAPRFETGDERYAYGDIFDYELSAGKITKFLAKFLPEPQRGNRIEYVVGRTFAIGDDTK